MMLEVHKISKDYSKNRILKGISFRADGGAISILGPNGAGKSTLLKILATVIQPTSGYFRLMEFRADRDLQKLRPHIGFVSHRANLYPQFSLRENALFFAHIYGVPSPEKEIYQLAEKLQLSDRLDQPVGEFSRGLLQRATLLRALLHSPTLLLLDEPFTGLDANSHQILSDIIREYTAQKKLVLFSTHNFKLAAELSQRAIFLKDGKIASEIDNPTESSLYTAISELTNSSKNAER